MSLHHHPEPDKSWWMTSKRDGKCIECKQDISAGDRIVFEPPYKAYCSECGVDLIGEDPKK